MKWAGLLAILLLFVSCGEKSRQAEEKIKIGKYVYIDAANTVHVDRNCLKDNILKNSELNNNVNSIRIPGVEFMETEKLRGHFSYYNFCSICVSDEIFEELQEIAGEDTEPDMY